MNSLEKKVALVTGSGSGIGRAVALLYAKEGAKVVVSDINEHSGKKTVQMITEQGGEASFFKADSSSAKDNEELVAHAVKTFGALHIACNNAGIGGPSAPTGEYFIEDWDKVLAINLSGVFYGCRYQIPALLAAGGGAIVNISSIFGQVAFENSPAYVAAKHGVVGLTKSIAVEYAKAGIRANAVAPAFIKTPLLDELDDNIRTALIDKHPAGRFGEAEEIANLVLWLSSDKASFVNGSYYAADGGYLAQ